MNDFSLYFSSGWRHIISAEALDHILFIIALAAIYAVSNWKQVLVLVTAFTVGHSLTLALSVYDVIRFGTKWVEFLIPCTIIVTAGFNFFVKNFSTQSFRLNYWLALFFGLIHGMGFANSIRFMLAKDQHIALPLLGFNVGLEAGQLLVVAFILAANFLFINKAGLKRKSWVIGLSACCFLLAIKMAVERCPF